MNRNQFINSICKQDSTTIMNFKTAIESALKNKDGSILNAKFTNRLPIILHDYDFKDGKLVLHFKATNPLPEFNGQLDMKTAYNVPPNLAVELPKLLLDLFTDLSSVEFAVYYTKFLVLKKPIICTIEPTKEIKKRARESNLTYNTGYNGNIETQEVDIKKYGVRDNEKIEPLYAIILAKLINKDIDDSVEKLKITSLNTIEYKGKKNSLHLTRSALLGKNEHGYIIIYDSIDGEDNKETSQEYIEKTYMGNEKIVALQMLDTIN